MPRKLLGLFPARIVKRRYGLKLPLVVGWTHPYAPLGTPLVDREAAEPVIAAWLAHLAENPRFPDLCCCRSRRRTVRSPQLSGPSCGARKCRQPSSTPIRARCWRRNGARSTYLEHALGGRSIANCAAPSAAWAKQARCRTRPRPSPPRSPPRWKIFWRSKPAAGKAKPERRPPATQDILDFVKAAVVGLAGEHKVAIDRLVLDGQPAAIGITLRSGDAAWFWKIAYDESLARYSPGVMLIAL